MSLGTGLDIVIVLAALGLFASTFRMEPALRTKQRLLAFAFLLMGASGFLTPVSERLALGVDAAGTLLFVVVLYRLIAAGEFTKKPTA